MKLTSLILLIPLLALAGTVRVAGPIQVETAIATNVVVGAAGAGCATWQEQPNTPNLFPEFGSSDYLTQKIKNTSGADVTICEVSVVVLQYTPSGCYVELWSGIDGSGAGSGTQYGTASATVEPIDYVCTFTWSSNPTIPANTDFYIVLRATGGYYAARCTYTDPYETGNGYDFKKGGADYGGVTSDLCFTVKKQ